MPAVPRIRELIVLLCVALSGCAGSGWMSGRSLLTADDKEAKPAKPGERQLENLLTEERPTRVTAAKPSASEERAAPALPASDATPERELLEVRLLAELQSRGELDAKTAAEMRRALHDSDGPVRDLLVQTLLATYKRGTPTARKEEPRPTVEQSITDTNPLREESKLVAVAHQEPPAASRPSVANVTSPPATSPPVTSPPATSPPATSPPATSPPVTSPPAHQSPVPPPEPDPWHLQLAKTIGALEAELAAGQSATPEERSRLEARLRLLYVAADRRSEAAQPIAEQGEHQREFWKSQLHAIGVLLDPKGPPGDDRRAALALRHVREAAEHLAGASTLDVRNLAFVSRVDSFGRFTEFPKAVFKPDQELLLYVEVDNFTVESKPGGYETTLEGSYQIFDAGGQRVADHSFPVEKETCLRPRRDFFIPYRMYVPKSLAPGDYNLHLTIKDLKGDKFGQGTIRFKIAD